VKLGREDLRCTVQVFAGLGIRFDHARFEKPTRRIGTNLPGGGPAARELAARDERWIDCLRALRQYAHPGAPRPSPESASGAWPRGSCPAATVGACAARFEPWAWPACSGRRVRGDTVRRKPTRAVERGPAAPLLEPAEGVYVGDSPEDVHMARAAGVFSVASRRVPEPRGPGGLGPGLLARASRPRFLRLLE